MQVIASAIVLNGGSGSFAQFIAANVANIAHKPKTVNFEQILKDFDAVFDTVGRKITDASFNILKKNGIIVSMVGQPNEDLAKQHGVTAIGQGTNTNASHLRRAAELLDSRKLKVEIDKVFPLE